MALEIAHQLGQAGLEVRLLALLDPPPVRSLEVLAPESASQVPGRRHFLSKRLAMYRRDLAARHLRDWPEYLGARFLSLLGLLRQGHAPGLSSTEFLRWRVLEANRHALWSYRPAPWSGEVCLIFTRDRAEGRARAARDFWIAHCNSAGREFSVPGEDSGDALGPEQAVFVAEILNGLLT